MQSLLQNIWADSLVSYFVFRSVHSRVSCQSLCILHLEMSTEDISLMSHFKIDYKIINAFLWSPILTSFQSIKKWAIVPHCKNSNLIHTYTQCHPEEKQRLKVLWGFFVFLENEIWTLHSRVQHFYSLIYQVWN